MPTPITRAHVSAALVAALATAAAHAQIPANVLVVNDDAPLGSNDGLSWPTAYRTLQAALDAAYASASTATVKNEIWIAAGNYISPVTPGSFCSGTITQLPEPFRVGEPALPTLAVYGGFAGTETDRSQRNITANVVNLRPSSSFAVATPISGGTLAIRGQGRVDGVTIFGTNLEVPCTFAVAGPTSVAMTENAVLANARLTGTQRGTPIVQARGFSRLEAITVQSTNSAELLDDASITDSVIANNSPSTGTFGGEWTGLLCRARNRVVNTRVLSNTYSPSTPAAGGGAGISATPQTLIINSKIELNRVNGAAASSGPYIAGVRQGTLVNTVVHANFRSATSYAVTDATLINCTVVNNRGTIAGGSFGRGVANSAIRNSIVYGHSSGGTPTYADQALNPTELAYSLIEAFTPADAPPSGAPGTSNANPILNSVFIPALGSPAIDAGNNLYLNAVTTAGGTAGLFSDYNHVARYLGGAGTDGLATPAGSAPRIDIGAVESPPVVPACYANVNGSVSPSPATNTLSPADFTAFLALYRSGHPLANCDASTAPTLSPADFTCFLAKYRAGCP